jgi:hypothetical protein
MGQSMWESWWKNRYWSFFLEVLTFSPLNVIPSALWTHLHLNISVDRSTNGRRLWSLQQTKPFRKSKNSRWKYIDDYYWTVKHKTTDYILNNALRLDSVKGIHKLLFVAVVFVWHNYSYVLTLISNNKCGTAENPKSFWGRQFILSINWLCRLYSSARFLIRRGTN